MCYTRLEEFLSILFFVLILNLVSNSASKSVHVSDEINDIFRDSDRSKIHLPNFNVSGISNDGNFAEGGIIKENNSIIELSPASKKLYTTVSPDLEKKKLITDLKSSIILHNTSASFPTTYRVTESVNEKPKASTERFESLKQLNENKVNLYLGVPQVHVNGKSSIKPRKGVDFNNTLVPSKWLNTDNQDLEHSANNIISCFQSSINECHNLSLSNINCFCCSKSNVTSYYQTKTLFPCDNCTKIILNFKYFVNCSNICCSDNTLNTKNNVTKFHQSLSNNFGKPSDSQYQKFTVKNFTTEKLHSPNLVSSIINANNVTFKKKPQVTKVPYDVDILTEIISKHSRNILVPVIVSVILLPLVGILVFFIWRKSKEYWDKRYYKRMDFLIDGMYNDLN